MKTIFKDLKLGFKSYLEAVTFIKTHKMWYYFLFPILIFVGIYYLGFVFQELKGEVIIDEKESIFVRSWYMFVRGFYALIAMVMFSFMRYILIILMSPILSVISERVERILTGNKYKFNLPQLIKDIKRTINLAIRNIIWEFAIIYGFYLIVIFVGWILGLPDGVERFIDKAFAMLVAFYYYGFGFIDYLNERQRLSIGESVKFVKKHRGFAIALGSVFTLIFVYTNDYFNMVREDISSSWILTIVIIASVIMATLPIITMVAATLGVHELVDLRKNPYALKQKSNEKKIPLDDPHIG